jgi:hypothetical protein
MICRARTEAPEAARHLLQAVSIVAVRCWRVGEMERDERRSIELVGQAIEAQVIDNGHDVAFTLVCAPDYEAVRMRLSQCHAAPLQDGVPAWEHAFTIARMQERIEDIDGLIDSLLAP